MSRLDPTMIIASVLIGLAMGAVVGPVLSRRIRSKYESTDQVECALRRDKPDEVITGRWLHGLATLSSGQIDFQPRTSLGVRLNSGAPFIITVLSIVSNAGRHPSWRHAWSIDPRLQIVILETATGPIELAISRNSIQQLVSKVNQAAQ